MLRHDVAQGANVHHFQSPFSPGAAPTHLSGCCELPLGSAQKSVQPRLVSSLGKSGASAWLGRLGRKVSRKRKLGTLQLCANPPPQSHLPPLQKGCVPYSRKIYPFPTQMSFLDQLLEGPAELNPRPVLLAPSPSASAGFSSLRSPDPSPRRRGTLAYDPVHGQGCPKQSAGGSPPGRL